jgi:hypothetical protein
MIHHIMFHDIGETIIGDLPYPVKSENSQLKEQLEWLEHRSNATQLEYWDAFQMVMLTSEDKKLFKDIELIEMAEFGIDQMCLGNDYGFIVANRCLRKVYENEPSPLLVKYVIKRLRLFSMQYQRLLRDSLGDWWSIMAWQRLEKPYGC